MIHRDHWVFPAMTKDVVNAVVISMDIDATVAVKDSTTFLPVKVTTHLMNAS